MAAAGSHNKGTWKDGWYYYWMYYSIPTVLVVIGLVVAVSFVHAHLTERPSALSVMMLDVGTDVSEESLQTAYMEAADIDPDVYSVTISTSLMLGETTETYQMTSIARLYAQVGTGDLDVVAMRGSDFANYTRADMFLDLREVFSKEALAAFPEVYTDANGAVLGIYCKDLPVMQEIGGYAADEDGVIGILYNSEHIENAARFLTYLGTAQ